MRIENVFSQSGKHSVLVAVLIAIVCALALAAGPVSAWANDGDGDLQAGEVDFATAEDDFVLGAQSSSGCLTTYDFFQAVGSTDAMTLLKYAPYASYTNLGTVGDATDVDTVHAALDYIRECNKLRAKHGLPELKVTDALMAAAESDVNWSDTNYAHATQFTIAENLAWGYSDPFDGWYYEEKRLYEKGASESEWGHYANIIDSSYTITGFAISKNGPMVCYGQVFYPALGNGEVAYTVDEWQARFDKWVETVPKSMFRLYNPNSGEHFYTASAKEKDGLVKAGWKYEGIGWTAPGKSNTPVYRLYSGTDHHYTTSVKEKDGLVKAGWSYEGVGWYSDDSKGVPLYRQFNPNVNPKAKRNNSGSHNYTTSKAENDKLVELGWEEEGIGWYGMK